MRRRSQRRAQRRGRVGPAQNRTVLLGLWLVPLELGSESAGKMAVAVGSHRLAVDWVRFKVTRSS